MVILKNLHSKRRRSILMISAGVAIFFAIFYFTYKGFGIKPGSYSVSEVSIGDVYQSIEAEGEILPEKEVLVLSPNNGIVQRVLKVPGKHIMEGEVILVLDQSELTQELNNTKDQLELLNNELQKLILSAKTTRIDLEHDIEVKKLKITSLKAELVNQSQLMDVGGISQAQIDKTKQELVLAEKELLRSTEKHRLRLKQLNVDEERTLLRISIQEKQIRTLREQIDKMIVRSPGTGIILEVRARDGENKKKNELLVRISEQTRLKIEGAISDKYSSAIRNGGRVYTDVDGEKLFGVIGNINPELEDDKIKFDVFLDHPRNEKIKLNQKVNLHIIQMERRGVLRLEKGEYFQTDRSNCYQVDEDQLLNIPIETGLIGKDYIEIKSGLDSGVTIVNSQMKRKGRVGSYNQGE